MNPSELPDEILFEGALKCCSAAERAAYLERVCAGKPELLAKLETLLASHDRAGEFLESAPAAGQAIRIDGAPDETPGTIIGRYKLLQKIGEGGMGVVYMAEQTAPVVRKVALKIIKLGMDTKEVVARFEAERQALALMDHSNIARVFDAGATDSGRPYFVMELVHGVPITEYCDKNQLSTQQRLELFIPVCQAIQHAHQKGIIHRDIKPSNVMVTLHDGVPVPKVIDFGVAKATNQRLTEKTLFTNYAQMIGTPAYMSPEQAEMSGLDVDTRSDIYSLGVLLYELLTGTTPFDAKDLLSKGYAEMQRIIVEQEPMKPSTRMSTLTNEQRTVVAKNRNAEESALRKGLQGDLDWIVMKCLEKDRANRYETSNALATDLRRHLANELISARPPTTSYLLKKLVKRNKIVFATTGVVITSLVVGFSVALWSLRNERIARKQAEANFRMAKQVVDESLSTAINEMSSLPQADRIQRKLQTDVVKYYESFVNQNQGDPSLRFELANAAFRAAKGLQPLEKFDMSQTMNEKALSLYEELTRQHPGEIKYRLATAKCYDLSAANGSALGRPLENLRFRLRTLSLWQQLHADFPDEPKYLSQLAEAHDAAGNTFRAVGRFKESLEHHQKGLSLYQEFRRKHPETNAGPASEASLRMYLGRGLESMNRLGDAETEYLLSHKLWERAVQGNSDPWQKSYFAWLKRVLAALYAKTGRTERAITLLRETVATSEELRRDWPNIVDFLRLHTSELRQIGALLQGLHRMDEAETNLRRALELDLAQQAVDGATSSTRASLSSDYYALGGLQAEMNRHHDAADSIRKAMELNNALLVERPADWLLVQSTCRRLSECPDPSFRDPARALALLSQYQRVDPDPGRPPIALGIAQLRLGNATAAVASFTRGLELTGGGSPEDWLYLAIACAKEGDLTKARAWYDQATAWMKKYNPVDSNLQRLRTEAAGLFEPAPVK